MPVVCGAPTIGGHDRPSADSAVWTMPGRTRRLRYRIATEDRRGALIIQLDFGTAESVHVVVTVDRVDEPVPAKRAGRG